ncbi:MAG: SAM-dependent methyltransferase [Rhodobiaceae bacterium]|nr:SAM-dependent methyltransferase [Rhodobiaceae bacterium]
MTSRAHRTRSSAVMAQRREPPDSLDFFPTPPWATRALFETLWADVAPLRALTAWDPACGQGHMAEPLRDIFGLVHASDVWPYGYGAVQDFTFDDRPPGGAVDWIVTNPPFNIATLFFERAIDVARTGVAFLVRLQFLETQDRYHEIFDIHPPTVIAFFADRVPMIRGAWDPEASTATAYVWLVWIRDAARKPPVWIPPGAARRYTRMSDMQLATPGEAARRREVQEARSGDAATGTRRSEKGKD